ncbi:MAG: tyrosine-type recombinase/integrase [Clostridia bacterium]|nr:tyrosine-type recombinase/integrase [Clostridia bacterium]
MARLVRKEAALDFARAVDKFLEYCRAKGLSEHTVSWYGGKLASFGEYIGGLNPGDIKAEHIRGFILERQEEVAVETINGYLRTLKAFFGFLVREGRLTENPMRAVPMVKGKKAVIPAFSREQVLRLLRMPDKSTFKGFRDYMIMLVMLDTGMRISEVCGLKVKDLDVSTGVIKVLGKGNKERFVYVSERTVRELKVYLCECLAEATEDWPLFPNQWGGRLSRRTFEESLSEYGRLAGISGVRVSPHTFRHTFAKEYLLNGGDMVSLQRLLGHTTLEMVRRYVNLLDREIAAQHNKFSPVEALLGEGKPRGLGVGRGSPGRRGQA